MNHPEAIQGAGAHDGRTRQTIAMLTQAERDKVETIAELEGRSVSWTMRMLAMRGVEQYEAETAAAEAQ